MFKRQATEIKDLKQEWYRAQKELEKKGFEEKEAANILKEGRKLEDLEFLKSQTPPGPFTNCAEVKNYLDNSKDEEKVKLQRLYKEVRYARKTSLSLPENADVFRLKREGKNLSIMEYGDNLMAYLDKSRSSKSLKISDLQHVLGVLKNLESETVNDDVPSVNDYLVGEHVIAVWREFDDNEKFAWYLGIVDAVNDDKLDVSYFEPTDDSKRFWILHADSQYLTDDRQIMYRHVKVSYKHTKTIRCSMDQVIVDQCKKMIESFSS